MSNSSKLDLVHIFLFIIVHILLLSNELHVKM